MNSEEKAIIRTIFQNKILKSNGQSFEDLFVNIMQNADSDFIPVKPQGNVGDRKNDGYNKKTGQYYQVFAPENPSIKLNDTVKKLKTDFEGLKSYWQNICPIKEYHFVFNDKYQGSNPTIEKELGLLRDTNSLHDCSGLFCKHLEDLVFSLPDDVIYNIVGHIPDPNKIGELPYSVLNEVLTHILKHKKQLKYEQILNVPDFDEKITFNGLSNHVHHLLQTASYHIGALESYFNSNSDFIKQEIRDNLNDIYKCTLQENYEQSPNDKSIPDKRFFDILKTCTPDEKQSTQDATLVVLAYFFESCDIFEDPE